LRIALRRVQNQIPILSEFDSYLSMGVFLSMNTKWIDAESVFKILNVDDSVRAIQRALMDGLDPALGFDRDVLAVEGGQLVLMPSQSSDFVGVKVVTVSKGNSALGLPTIQGMYVLIESQTLCPVALIDGAAITALRTPAVSASVVEYLAPSAIDDFVLFGSGAQAWGHFNAIRTVKKIGRVTIVARNRIRGAELASRIQSSGQRVRSGSPENVREAQLIVCATTSRNPLFDGGLVPDDSLTIAIGSHEATSREVSTSLVVRAQLVVEDQATALREAGDLVIPIAEGAIRANSLVSMRDIITGVMKADFGKPRIFKSVGMSWEDLIIASEVFRLS